eukprot:scaffold1396_cov252-Pinguiococcus_pyrenoidosus.AAC.24
MPLWYTDAGKFLCCAAGTGTSVCAVRASCWASAEIWNEKGRNHVRGLQRARTQGGGARAALRCCRKAACVTAVPWRSLRGARPSGRRSGSATSSCSAAVTWRAACRGAGAC